MQPRPAFFTTADFAVRAHDKITTPQMRTMKLQFPTPFQLTGLVPRSHPPIYHLILIAVLILLPAFSAHAQSAEPNGVRLKNVNADPVCLAVVVPHH